MIPLFNEEASVDNLLFELYQVLNKLPLKAEVILVNDSSTDNTASKLHAASKIFGFKTITFHENSGHANAIWCGMRHAEGEMIITMDGDLQHPPNTILDLISEFTYSNVDVVYAIRNDLSMERILKRSTSHLFFVTFRYIFGLRLIPYANDFRLISKRYFEFVTSESSDIEIVRALLASHHHSYKTVGFNLQARRVGDSKFTFRKMINLYMRTLVYAPWSRSVFLMIIGFVIFGALVLSPFSLYIHPILKASLLILGVLSIGLGFLVLIPKLRKLSASGGLNQLL